MKKSNKTKSTWSQRTGWVTRNFVHHGVVSHNGEKDCLLGSRHGSSSTSRQDIKFSWWSLQCLFNWGRGQGNYSKQLFHSFLEKSFNAATIENLWNFETTMWGKIQKRLGKQLILQSGWGEKRQSGINLYVLRSTWRVGDEVVNYEGDSENGSLWKKWDLL